MEEESFDFRFFDSDLSPGKCTYTVQVSTNSITDVTPGLMTNDAELSALAADNR